MRNAHSYIQYILRWGEILYRGNRRSQVVPSITVIFCTLWHISGGIGGGNGFVYQIISYWDDIRWEGEMLHDLSEVDLGLAISDVTDWKDYRVMPMHDFN